MYKDIPWNLNYSVSESGDIFSKKTNKILKPYKQKSTGYYTVNLYNNRKRETVLIHRIVAKVYIPNPENKPNVNHIDFDPSNNAVHNLEWVTQKENVAHTHKHKRNANFEGERSSNSKLTDKEAYEIKFRFTKFTTNKELSEIYGVGEETVRKIRKGLRWKHIIFNMFND